MAPSPSPRGRAGRQDSDSGLTPRESEVLERLATGARTRDIAGDLRIAEPTVKRHLTNIYRKLGVTNRVEAVTWHLGERQRRPSSKQSRRAR